jgi:hypothetical protein
MFAPQTGRYGKAAGVVLNDSPAGSFSAGRSAEQSRRR